MISAAYFSTVALGLAFPANGWAARPVEPIKVCANQVNWAVDPSWSLQEKQNFVSVLDDLSRNISSRPFIRLSPRNIFDSEGDARTTLPPESAAAQVLDEILARPRLIPSVVEALRMSGLNGSASTATSLEELSERIRKQTPIERYYQLRQLHRIRQALYDHGLNKGDLILWAQNHLNALYDGEQRHQFVLSNAYLLKEALDDRPLEERLFPLALRSRQTMGPKKWDTETLPESFLPKRHLVVIAIPQPGRYLLPMKGYNGDLPTYIQGNVSPKTSISGQHHDVLIAGELGEESSLSIREGIVSARALNARSRLIGGMLVIIGDIGASRDSDILRNYRETTVIEVPENRRADIFLWLTGQKGLTLRLERPSGRNLVEILEKLRRLGLLRAIYPSADDRGRLRRSPSLEPLIVAP